MKIDCPVQIWREGEQFVAHAMPLGSRVLERTLREARVALDEAVSLFLVTAQDQGTLEEALDHAGCAHDGEGWKSPDWICFEKGSAAVGA